MKKLSTATILAIIIALLVATGALASFNNGNFETGDFTGWTKDTANQNGGILVGPPPSYVPHPVASVDRMSIVNTAWMDANFGPGITCDPYSNGLICLPYAGANSAVVNYAGNNGNLNRLTQSGLVAGGDLGLDGNYHIFFSYAPVLDKGSHTPADQPFMYVKLVRVRSGSPDVVLFDKFSYPDDGNPNWQVSPVSSSVKFMPWQVYDLTYAPGDLAPGDTLTLEVVAAGCVYFQGAHWGYVYVDEFGPTAPAGNTAPSISSVSPPSGPDTGGTSVTITGSNFTGATAVKIGATTLLAGSFTIVNNTTITFTTPANAAGLVDVSVTNPSGSAVYPYSYTFLASPTITSIVPSSGPTAGGTSVVITGTALTGGTVTFDGLPATCTVDSATQITCTSPAHAAGPVNVVVTTIAGSATSTGGFTYIAPPTITSIVPNSGPTAGGTSVVITGTNLTGGTVTFGGLPATCVVNSATQMTCTSPAHAAGPVDVVVTTVGGPATSVGGFTYIPAPTITTIVPNSGPIAGGTSVVITGTALTGGTVTFGGLPATCVVNSDTQITCTSPAHAAGPVNVVVTTPSGSATSTGGFTYIAAATITGLTPNIGPTAGGTSVVITGVNFTGATGVTFDGLAGTCTVNSDTQITCATPPHPVGTVDVVVISPILGNGTLPGGFTYIAPLPDNWGGTATVISNQPIVTIGRPQVGIPQQISAYAGFGNGANTAYLPMLFKKAFAGGSYNSAFYIQNTSTNTATFDITYYNLNGSVACTVNDSLAQGNSEGYWVPAETCLPDGWVGGAVITSNNPIVVVGRPHVGSEVMSYNALQNGGTTAHLSMLFRAAFDGSYNAAIYVQNISNAAATFTMSFYSEAGALTCTMTGQTIPAHGIRNYWLPSQTCVPVGWSGGVTITSNENVVALARTHVGSQISTYAGFNSAGNQAYVPMLFRRAFADNYNSAIYIQNVTNSAATVTISYRKSDGTETCSDTVNLAARAAGRIWMPSQSCVPEGWAGGALITSTQNIVTVGRTHVLAKGEVAAYPGHSAAFNQAYLPMLFRVALGSYESAMYVQNVSASPADISVTFRDASGVVSCIVNETLPAFATKGYWLPSVCTP